MKRHLKNLATIVVLVAILVIWTKFEQSGEGTPDSPNPSSATATPGQHTPRPPSSNPTSPSGKTYAGTVQAVSDGDTVRVRINGVSERVRLLGVDAPEVHTSQDCGGDESWDHLEELLKPGDKVTVVTDPKQAERDQYERILGYIDTADGIDVGYEQIASGWAGVFRLARNSARYPSYLDALKDAKSQNLGVWGIC